MMPVPFVTDTLRLRILPWVRHECTGLLCYKLQEGTTEKLKGVVMWYVEVLVQIKCQDWLRIPRKCIPRNHFLDCMVTFVPPSILSIILLVLKCHSGLVISCTFICILNRFNVTLGNNCSKYISVSCFTTQRRWKWTPSGKQKVQWKQLRYTGFKAPGTSFTRHLKVPWVGEVLGEGLMSQVSCGTWG